MAPYAFDVSIVSSASRLLALLDLSEEQKMLQNMEDMDIDLVMDVPDTPDRLESSKNGNGDGEKETTSSVAGNSENSELLCRGVPCRLRGRSKLTTGNGNTKRFNPQPWEDLSIRNGTRRGNSPVVKSLDNTSVSKNAHLFGRLAHPKHSEHTSSSSCGLGGDRAKLGVDCSGIAKVLAPDVGIQDGSSRKVIDLSSPEINGRKTRRVTGNINLDEGKGLCTEVPCRHSACINKNGVLALTGQHQYTGMPERSCGDLKNFTAQEARRSSITDNGFSSLHTIANSSRAPSNDCKGKAKIDDTCTVTAVASDHLKSIDLTHVSQPNTREMALESMQPSMPPRRTGQKRLVRNGCISPLNIARAKQTAENYSKGSVDVEQADVGGLIPIEGPSCLINTVSPDSGSNRTGIVKGKGVMKDPNPAGKHDADGMHLPRRGSLTHTEEDNVITDGHGSAFRCSEGIGGWRSVRNCSKMPFSPPLDEVVRPSRSDQRQGSRTENMDHVGAVNNCSATDFVEISDRSSLKHNPNSVLAPSSSSFLSELDRENRQQCRANKLMRRQKKQGSTCSNTVECSTSTPDDSGIGYVLSSGEPFNVRSTRRRNPNCRGNSGPVMVIDDLSPETRGGNSLELSELVNNYPDARARQVEADEILARQLQEQFYSEFPRAVGELDANIAWTLQQEEDARHASFHGNARASHPRDASMSHLYRQYPSRSFRNLSVRTANRARPPSSRRIGRPRTSSGGRTVQFPPDMDFETRIHTLEALEAAVGNSNDMRLAGHLFQRDFNENDYEILLALDENNHQHVGASANVINRLPQSTVQTENFEEACAICLETPSTGDIIRHLPCLHKFHKDCIDPWLRRKTSCPVCKSSIT